MGFLRGSQRQKRGGWIVIRTIWIAALCLAGLGGLFATRVTASISEEAVRDPATVGVNRERDTLTKGDRLDVAYLRQATESIPVAPAVPITEEIQPAEPFQFANRFANPSATATVESPVAPGQAAGPSATPSASSSASSSARRSMVLLPKPRPKIRPAKNKKDVGVAGAAVDPATCHQQDGFGGLLISLSGAPRCEL
jgi:hypothetical protein